jgi:hypothetical protein
VIYKHRVAVECLATADALRQVRADLLRLERDEGLDGADAADAHRVTVEAVVVAEDLERIAVQLGGSVA